MAPALLLHYNVVLQAPAVFAAHQLLILEGQVDGGDHRFPVLGKSALQG